MKTAVIIAIAFLALLLSACEFDPEGDLAGASTDRTAKYWFRLADADVTINDDDTGRLKVISDNATDDSMGLTFYGKNASADVTETLTGFNNTNIYSTDVSLASIDKLVLNASASGTVTVSDNATGATIATFTTGQLVAYNAASFDGVAEVPPLVQANGMTEYVLWTDCDVNVSNNAVSFSYWVSPDNVKWFDGGVAVSDCVGTAAKTTLTDAGVAYLKLNINNQDTVSNKVFAYFTYK